MGTNCLIWCGVVLLVADDQRSYFMTNGHLPPVGGTSVLLPRLSTLAVSRYSRSSVSPTWQSASYGGLVFLSSVVRYARCISIVWEPWFPYLALTTPADTIPSPSFSSISSALIYSSKYGKESASGIKSGVRTSGSSNVIGCGGGVSESPSLDRMIRLKLSCFNDSAALRCSSLVNLQNVWYVSSLPWSLRMYCLITVPLCSHGPIHRPRCSTGYGKTLSESR